MKEPLKDPLPITAVSVGLNFFSSKLAENRDALEYFDLPAYTSVQNAHEIRYICKEALKLWGTGAIPSYLSLCYNVFQKGAETPESETKAFIKECFELHLKSHRMAVIYNNGYIRDVQACMVWEWLIYSIINTL